MEGKKPDPIVEEKDEPKEVTKESEFKETIEKEEESEPEGTPQNVIEYQNYFFSKKTRQILVTMFDRVPNKNKSDVTAWQRLLRLKKTCDNNNLFAMFSFPAREKQLYSSIVGNFTTDNGEQFYKGQSKTPVPEGTLTYQDEILITSHRCAAVIVGSEKPCRFKQNKSYFLNDNTGEEDHKEILFIIEIAKGDAQPLLTSILSEDTVFYVEVPAYWEFYLKDFSQQKTDDNESRMRVTKLKRNKQIDLEGADDDLYVYYKFDNLQTGLEIPDITPEKPDELKYANDPAMTIHKKPQPQLLNLLLVPRNYSNEKQGAMQFETDYNAIVTLNEDKPITDRKIISALIEVYNHMLQFVRSNPDKKAYMNKILAVESKFAKLGMPVEDAFAQWYKTTIKNPSYENLSMLRHYTKARNMDSEEIAHEKALLETAQLSSAQRADIIHYIWNNFTQPSDWQHVPLTRSVDVSAMHNRLMWLRRQHAQERQKQAIGLQDLQTDWSKDKQNTQLKAAVRAKEEELVKQDQKMAALEKAFRVRLKQHFDEMLDVDKTKEKQKLYQQWINESAAASQNAWVEATTDTSGPSETSAAAETASVVKAAATTQKVKTLSASPEVDQAKVTEILDKFKKTVDDTRAKEQEEIKEIAMKIKHIFANMTATRQEILDISQGLIEQDTLDPKKIQAHLMEANTCYRSAVSVAIQAGIAKISSSTEEESKKGIDEFLQNQSLQEMRSYLEIIKSNDKCLINYKEALKLSQEESKRLFETQRSEIIQQNAQLVNTMLDDADTAITEVKTLLIQKQSLTTGSTADMLKISQLYEARIQLMEKKRNEIDEIHQTLLTLKPTEEEYKNQITLKADLDAVVKKAQVLLEEIVAQLLELQRQIENPETTESLLMLQQLKGSEIDVREARRKARESADLAAMYYKNMQLAEAAQKKAIQDAALINNPFRKLGISREDIARREQRQNEHQEVLIRAALQQLKRLLGNKSTSLDILNSAVTKLERLFELNQHTNSPTFMDLRKQAHELKLQVIKRQQTKGAQEEEEEEEEEEKTGTQEEEGDEGDEFNIDEENVNFEEKEDLIVAMNELALAIENEDTSQIPQLIQDMNVAEQRAGLRSRDATVLRKAAKLLLQR